MNITSAAERLFTSQPGISKQLKQLEAELGVQLFTRKGKSLAAITPAGREVIARARKILREVGNITSLASDLTAELDGTLSIATTHTQARYVLPEVIRAFRERYPRVDLELHQGTSEQIAELIEHQQGGLRDRDGLAGPVLAPDADADLPLASHRARAEGCIRSRSSRSRSTLQALADHPLVTYVFSGTGESSFKRAFREQGLEPRVVFTARDADIIKTYVRMGMGVGVIASMAFECSDREDLVAIDASELFPRVTTWLGFPRDMVLRGYMVDFVALLAPHLTPQLTRRPGNRDTGGSGCADRRGRTGAEGGLSGASLGSDHLRPSFTHFSEPHHLTRTPLATAGNPFRERKPGPCEVWISPVGTLPITVIVKVTSSPVRFVQGSALLALKTRPGTSRPRFGPAQLAVWCSASHGGCPFRALTVLLRGSCTLLCDRDRRGRDFLRRPSGPEKMSA